VSPLAQLAEGQAIEIEAEGGSMFPVIRNGDRVRVEPIETPVGRGDVVLVVINGAWVLHRVVDVSETGVITQGDNQPHPDPPVTLAHAVGRATHARGRITVPLRWPRPLTRLWLAARPLRQLAAQLVLR
jgi:signal peptidase I